VGPACLLVSSLLYPALLDPPLLFQLMATVCGSDDGRSRSQRTVNATCARCGLTSNREAANEPTVEPHVAGGS